MTIGKRIFEVRNHKNIKLSQEKFGHKVGLSKYAISGFENGNRSVTDRTITDICREFNVNEHWLRTGEGEMFAKPERISLDEFAAQNELTSLELDIIKALIEIPKEVRAKLVSRFKSIFGEYTELAATSENQINIEEEVERYRQELEAELKGAAKSSVILDTKGTKEA